MKLGIDLGGTKIEILALDQAGSELARRRIDTPRGAYEPILKAVTQLVRDTEASLGREGSLGIGIPGAEDPATGLIKNANTTELVGHAFRQDLEKELQRSVRLANDANCFALSEAIDGAAKGERVVFGVILGTGCGGGLVVDGKIIAGRNAIGGEWGHNRLPDMRPEEYPGPACYCGHRGCIETFVSGTGLARDFHEVSGRKADSRTISHWAESGDADALAAFERLEERLARSLAALINIVDPDCIVVGGGLSNVARIYENVPKLWGSYIFSNSPVSTRLVRAQFGDSSGVRGAARLW